jgi:N-carbamoylputrescine amidase
MTLITVAALQMSCGDHRETNVQRVEELIRIAAARGAQVILPQELFETVYFCKEQRPQNFEVAHPWDAHPTLPRLQRLAQELEVVLPVSFFERAGQVFFNSLAMVDADGSLLGIYRKSHIPDGPGYQEKFYFSPGDTGFRVWKTRYGCLGVGICWDQWFPEAARCMVLAGAEVLLYPTAIGSEPQDPQLDSKAHWQRTMQGHAAANLTPVVAANRVGVETGETCSLTFYGSSFIAGSTGELLQEAPRDEDSILLHEFDLTALAEQRRAWGVFRDRRPDLYKPLLSLDDARGSGK